MEKGKCKKKRIVSLLVVSLAVFLMASGNKIDVGTSTTQKMTVDYSIESVWNGTGVTRVLQSENHLYLLKDGKTLISIQNGQEQGVFVNNETIRNARAWKTAVIIVDEKADYYWTIDFENSTSPQKTANMSVYGEISYGFSMYNQYLYFPLGEFGGFHIIDYSIPTSPVYQRSFSVSWHAMSPEIVADCGLFMGDTATNLYYMENNPISPKRLWRIENPSIMMITGTAHSYGKMGVSEKYVAYFANDYIQKPAQTVILVIPRINKTHIKQPYNVSVEELELTRGLIRENILVSTHLDQINLWSINEIKQTVGTVGTIEGPEIGSFSFWQWIENTDTFYVVNEEKGVFLLSFILTETPGIIPAIPYSFTLIILGCFTRWRRRKI